MQVTKGKVVSLIYLLKNSEGEELDRADATEPFTYLHGVGQMVPGLESQLEGLKKGDQRQDIVVEASQAYGDVREELKLKVSREQFPADADLSPGMQFWASTNDGGQHPFTVVSVAGSDVHIDGNHPLAGETLYFNIEIYEVRDATEEELEHGHAHGPGGAHH